jgi:hypothetical protein
MYHYFIKGKTLSFSNLYTNLYGDSLNLGGIMGMMILWTLIYIPIAWYIERIFPGNIFCILRILEYFRHITMYFQENMVLPCHFIFHLW